VTVDQITVAVADVMLDHPAWLVAEDGAAYRAVWSGSAVWTLTCSPAAADGREVRIIASIGGGPAPLLDVLDPADLAGRHPVVGALRLAGPVARLRNPDLWDALATSIIRQVIRAGQARKLYRAFCQEHGQRIETAAGPVWLFPSPEAVLALPDDDFARLGLAFKAKPLRAAADAYLQHGPRWAGLEPSRLVTEVQTVPRIGPWTAGATVADLTNDFSLYPFADLAVRTWAARLVPDQDWPETEPEFARVWQAAAGAQLSRWTLLTLAFGVRHASRTGTVAV
jgi:DNA-3-methyladenine glycosylase II